MSSCGSLGLRLAFIWLTLFTISPLSRSASIPANSDELTDDISNAITESVHEYNALIGKYPEQATLLVAMTIHDLFSNGSNGTDHQQWNTVVNWLRLCGIALHNSTFSADFNLNNTKLNQNSFSVRTRSSKFGNFHSDIDQLDYQQVVMKWRDEMKKMEKDKSHSGKYLRMVELAVSILPKWKQLVDSYFEHITLPKLLDPLCKDKIYLQFGNDFYLSLANVSVNQTAQTLTTYLSSICPTAPFSMPNATTYKQHHQEMIIPDGMKHFVVESAARLPAKTNLDGHLVMMYDDAINWTVNNYVQYLTGNDSNRDSLVARKIVYYLTVLKLFEQSKQENTQSHGQNGWRFLDYFVASLLLFVACSCALGIFVVFKETLIVYNKINVYSSSG